MTSPKTRTLTLLTAGFGDGTQDTQVVDREAGDIWTVDDVTRDITLHLAARPEMRFIDSTQPNRPPVVVPAKPQRTVIWFKHWLKSFEFHDAQAFERAHPGYQPPSAS